MDMKEKIAAAIRAAAEQGIAAGVFPEAELAAVELEVPPKKEMGDFATNFAMKSAKAFHKSPRQIAEELIARIARDGIDRAEIAGPGFINFYLTKDVIYDGLRKAIEAGEAYGNLPNKNLPKVQVEYVSANPTGPLQRGGGQRAGEPSACGGLRRGSGVLHQRRGQPDRPFG